MGSYRHKDGARVITTTVYDKAMNKRGISKVVHIIPEHPAYASLEFVKALAVCFGPAIQSQLAQTNEVTSKSISQPSK